MQGTVNLSQCDGQANKGVEEGVGSMVPRCENNPQLLPSGSLPKGQQRMKTVLLTDRLAGWLGETQHCSSQPSASY